MKIGHFHPWKIKYHQTSTTWLWFVPRSWTWMLLCAWSPPSCSGPPWCGRPDVWWMGRWAARMVVGVEGVSMAKGLELLNLLNLLLVGQAYIPWSVWPESAKWWAFPISAELSSNFQRGKMALLRGIGGLQVTSRAPKNLGSEKSGTKGSRWLEN